MREWPLRPPGGQFLHPSELPSWNHLLLLLLSISPKRSVAFLLGTFSDALYLQSFPHVCYLLSDDAHHQGLVYFGELCADSCWAGETRRDGREGLPILLGARRKGIISLMIPTHPCWLNGAQVWTLFCHIHLSMDLRQVFICLHICRWVLVIEILMDPLFNPPPTYLPTS